MLCSEVDVPSHIFVVGRVVAVGLALGIVGRPDVDGREVVGVRPCLATAYHLPPHTDILDWGYP